MEIDPDEAEVLAQGKALGEIIGQLLDGQPEDVAMCALCAALIAVVAQHAAGFDDAVQLVSDLAESAVDAIHSGEEVAAAGGIN